MADGGVVGLGPLLQDDTDDAASEEAESNTSKVESKSRKKKTGQSTSNTGSDDTPKVMDIDPNLPSGWSRKVSQRKSGASAGHYDVYIISPDKTRFRSRTEIAAYIKANRLKLNAEDFDFSPFGRHVNTKRLKKAPLLTYQVNPRGRGRPPKDEKKSTPTLASRLKVKMNFSSGRKRKGAAEDDDDEEEKPSSPTKRRRVSQKAATPARATPKGKAAASKAETPKRGRGRPPKSASKETPAKQSAAGKVAAKLKKVTANKKTPGRKKKRKASEIEEKESDGAQSEKEVATENKEKESGGEDENTSALEIHQLEESPRKRRVAKRPGRFAEGLTDEEINAPPPKPTPKTPKSVAATPKASPGKKKAPPKPKRKSVSSKAAAETPKRNKEIEDEANLIASLTAQIEKAEALVKITMDEEQQAEDPMETMEEPEFVSSPETLIRKPNPADTMAADNIWTPKPQSSRYSGRKITPKIRSSPEEEIPTPRKHAGRGRGKNSKLLKRQNSKTGEVGRKRNKIAPPVPPKPRRKSKSESKSSHSALPVLEVPDHNTTTAHTHMPPAPPQKPHISDDLLVNSEITEQSYEEFLSAVESGVPDLDPSAASTSMSAAVPKKISPKSAIRTPKQRTISESEIKLGLPIRDEDIIHTPPPTSPLVPSDDHSYSLSSRKYPALSMPPRSQPLGENGEDIAVPRFVSSTTAAAVAPHSTVTAALATTSALSSTESTSQGESSEEEMVIHQPASALPASLSRIQGQQQQQVILGGLSRRRKSSGEGAKSILIKSPTSVSGQIVTTSEGQSVLAQVLSRPQEYTASKKPRSKKVKTVVGSSSTGPQQVITQIVSKEGKVVYGGGDGGSSTGGSTPQLIRMSSGSGGQVILTSQPGASTPTAGQFTLIKQSDGGKVLVRKVGGNTAVQPQQTGFTQLSNITGVNQRIVLAAPSSQQKKPGQSLLARVVSAATASSGGAGGGSAVVTQIMPSTTAAATAIGATTGGDDDSAVVVCTSANTSIGASSNTGGIKFLYAGSSPPRSLALSLSENQVTPAASSSQSVVSEMICSAAPTDIMESPSSSSLADSATLLQDHLAKSQEGATSPDDNDQINRDNANGLENLTDKL